MAKLSTYLRPFLEYVEVDKGRSPLTVRNYSFYLQRFVDWAKDPNPADISEEMMHNYRLYLNRLEARGQGTLKKTTQNYHLIALRTWLKFLARRNVQTLSSEKVDLAKQGSREVSFLDGDDLDRILRAPETSDNAPIVQARDQAILELFFSTGMRVSELASLTREQINLKRDEFTIRGKGDKTRIVFVSERAKNAIKAYLERRADVSPFLFIRHDRAAGGEIGGPLTPRSIERLVHRYAVLAGITKHVSPHTLRHSFATDLLINGADIRSVQTMLGHASITTTQLYTHITNQQLQEVHQHFHGAKRNHKPTKT